jgi:hypothetical protein
LSALTYDALCGIQKELPASRDSDGVFGSEVRFMLNKAIIDRIRSNLLATIEFTDDQKDTIDQVLADLANTELTDDEIRAGLAANRGHDDRLRKFLTGLFLLMREQHVAKQRLHKAEVAVRNVVAKFRNSMLSENAQGVEFAFALIGELS